MAEIGSADQTAAAAPAGADAPIRRAILSVSDKRGIVELADGLAQLGIEIVSTGGTARELDNAGIATRPITELTGFPEMMDGRVKTLHPRIYAGVLGLRDDERHVAAAREQNVDWIDLVCVNLYPFESTAARPGATEAEIIEDIDIGGPAMIRAAAKNLRFVAPLTSPDRYEALLAELRASGGRLSLPTRRELAAEAVSATARYDAAISRWLTERAAAGSAGDRAGSATGAAFPAAFTRAYEKVEDLAYGENPHQRAAYYREVGAAGHLLGDVSKLGGKPLSYNNLLDLSSARALVDELAEPACAIVKHNIPCGVAVASGALDAYRRAFEGDPLSAFGGVIALNRPVDRELAQALLQQFVELLIAPGFDDDALEALRSKPNMRILAAHDAPAEPATRSELELRQVAGAMLVQEGDRVTEGREQMDVASKREPTADEWRDLLFAWTVCRHVRSNAIVLARDSATVGIGAGQMSRVDAVEIAVRKAGERAGGAAVASDAFFPFPDGPQAAIDGGATAIIQPGGSKGDADVIAAADAAGIAMVFTGRRHFRH